jgi:O-antigen/teichoic acid export membrane protein
VTPAFAEATARKSLGRIARLSAAFLASNLTRGAIAFALSLVAARALGVERFGRWVLCTTWASTLTIAADLGFGMLLTRDIARVNPGTENRRTQNPRTINPEPGTRYPLPETRNPEPGMLLGTALTARFAFAIAAAAVLGIFAPRLASGAETIAGLRIAALLGVTGAVYGCFGSTFRSQPRWVPTILIVETSWAIGQLVVSWMVLHQLSPPSHLLALLIVATAVQLAQIGSAIVVWRLAFGDDRVRRPSWAVLSRTVRRALPFAASGIVANLHNRVAPLMLGYLSTQTELGSFAAAARFGTTARLTPGAIFAGALPVLSREYSDDATAGRTAYRSFHIAMIWLAIGTAIPCVLFAPLLVRLVYGRAFVTAAPALIWIGIGLLPALTNSAKKIFLYASGEETLVLQWSAVSLGTQIAAGLALVPPFGSVGAAASIALGEAVIWWPLRRTLRRSAPPSSPRREPASTIARAQPVAPDVPDPAAAR